MLLDPETLDLAPVAPQVLERLGGDERFKLELPAAQIEIVLPPARSVAELAPQLAAARRELAAAAGGIALLAGAGLHPFAAVEGVLNRGERYERDRARVRNGRAAPARLRVPGACRGRGSGPHARGLQRAARAAAGARRAGRQRAVPRGARHGFASFRPMIAGMLPRQGMPPPIASWEEWAEELGWGARSGRVPAPSQWWFELRPHPSFGTLELRVCDTQATAAEAMAIAAVAQALVARLVEHRHGGVPSWRIEENRWVAARHGLDGDFAELLTGDRVPVRERLRVLLDEMEPYAAALGSAEQFAFAR